MLMCACIAVAAIGVGAPAGGATKSPASAAAAPGGDASATLPMLDPDELALWQRLSFRVEDAFDSTNGGFVSKRGILDESAVELGFLLGRRDRQERWRGYSLYTVQWMLGLEDSVGGGFYARHETVPGLGSFDRPTLLNAHRLENLIDAWEATNDSRYWVSAVRLLEFAERNVVDGRGGFTSDPVGDQDLIPQVNGVAIHAWLRWWAAGKDPKRREFALRSIDRMWETAWVESLGFVRTNSFGGLLMSPQLSDQVEMGRALVMSAYLAGRTADLDRARRVAEGMIERFGDERGTFRTEAPIKHGRLSRHAPYVARENARAALFLAELAHVAHEPKYLAAARRVWRAWRKELEKTKLETSDWVLAMDAAIDPVFPKRPPETVRPSERGRTPRSSVKSRLPVPETKIGVESPR